MKFRSVLALVASALALLGGCGSLPDGKPYADASSALASSVVASGRAVADSMTEAASVMPNDEKAAYENLQKDFEAAWAERVAATRAAARYADDIAALIDAGNSGGETAGKVADSLKTLAESVNIPVASPAVGAAGELARFIVTRIAIVRASQGLESAIAQAQPAIDRIAEEIVGESDMRLKSILLNVYKNTRSAINAAYDEDANFAKRATKLRNDQRQKIVDNPSAVPRLLDYDRIQTTVAANLQERDRKLTQASAAYRARLQLINAMSAATVAWAQANRDLSVAIKEKRKVSAAELTNTIAELRALSRKVSEL